MVPADVHFPDTLTATVLAEMLCTACVTCPVPPASLDSPNTRHLCCTARALLAREIMCVIAPLAVPVAEQCEPTRQPVTPPRDSIAKSSLSP